jgi:Mce-associated membrane protein
VDLLDDARNLSPGHVHATPGGRSGLPFSSASRRLVGALAALAVLLAGAAAYLGFLAWNDARTQQAADDAMAAARSGAETLFSYDHRTIDADLAAAKKILTGKLATDYGDTSVAVKRLATENRAIVEASISEAGVVSAEPGRVVVLLYLNQSTQSKNLSGPRLDMSRVRVTMVEVGGDWRLARAEPL